MEVEVVAAGVAAHKLGSDGHDGGKQNDRRAGEALPESHSRPGPAGRVGDARLRLIPRSLIPDPLVFMAAGAACGGFAAATAAGVKASGNVVPPYQSFHWSRK